MVERCRRAAAEDRATSTGRCTFAGEAQRHKCVFGAAEPQVGPDGGRRVRLVGPVDLGGERGKSRLNLPIARQRPETRDTPSCYDAPATAYACSMHTDARPELAVGASTSRKMAEAGSEVYSMIQ